MMNFNEWSKIGLAFAVGVSLSAGYVALGSHEASDPKVVVVEERCGEAPARPDTNPGETQQRTGPSAQLLAAFGHDPAYYGLSEAEQKRLVETCELRGDGPVATLSPELVAALSLDAAEREAWEGAIAGIRGQGTAQRFIFLEELAPTLDRSSFDDAEEFAAIEERIEASKRDGDEALYRIIAEERAGQRPVPTRDELAEASAWVRWKRWRLSEGDRFAAILSVELGTLRVDELRKVFGGWPGEGTLNRGCVGAGSDTGSDFALEGALGMKIVARIVRAHRSEIQTCFETRLKDDPRLAGKLVIDFTITSEGKVDPAVLNPRSTLGHPASERCVLDAVSSWSFPKPMDGAPVQVSYPFELAPE